MEQLKSYSDTEVGKVDTKKHITEDTIGAVGWAIEQGTGEEMWIQDQQITGIINLTQDHEVANKLHLNDQTTLVRSYVDEKHR